MFAISQQYARKFLLSKSLSVTILFDKSKVKILGEDSSEDQASLFVLLFFSLLLKFYLLILHMFPGFPASQHTRKFWLSKNLSVAKLFDESNIMSAEDSSEESISLLICFVVCFCFLSFANLKYICWVTEHSKILVHTPVAKIFGEILSFELEKLRKMQKATSQNTVKKSTAMFHVYTRVSWIF